METRKRYRWGVLVLLVTLVELGLGGCGGCGDDATCPTGWTEVDGRCVDPNAVPDGGPVEDGSQGEDASTARVDGSMGQDGSTPDCTPDDGGTCDTDPDPADPRLLRFEDEDASFRRAGVATYLTGPPNEAGGFMAVAAEDEIRREDWRKTPTTGLYLLEGAAAQVLEDPGDLTSDAWTLVNPSGLATIENDETVTAPLEGAGSVARIHFGSSAFDRVAQPAPGLTDGAKVTGSIWARVETGTHTVNLYWRDKSDTSTSVPFELTTAWQRLDATFDVGSGDADPRFTIRGSGTERDVLLWMPNLTEGTYPTSTITGQGTRSADALTYPASAVEEALLGRPWRWTVMPLGSSMDVLDRGRQYLLNRSSPVSRLYLGTGGGEVDVNLRGPDSETNGASVTYGRLQELTIAADVEAGDFLLEGFTTGDGGGVGADQDWARGTGTFDVHSDGAGAAFDGLFEEPRVYVPPRRALRFAGEEATFSRASEATYLTEAPNGTGGFMATATTNELRREDWRKALSQGLFLLEGEAEQLLPAPTDLTDTAGGWYHLGEIAVEDVGDPGPHPAHPAQRVVFTTASDSVRPRFSDFADETDYTFSVWARTLEGTYHLRLRSRDTTGDIEAYPRTVTPTWQRFDFTFNTKSGSGPPHVDFVASPLGEGTILVGPVNLTRGTFPTSTILVPGTRAADVLTVDAPLDEPFRVSFLPLFDHQDAAGATLLSTAEGDALAHLESRFVIIDDWASAVETSDTLRWDPHQLLALTADPSGGTLEAHGFSSGDGRYSGPTVVWSGTATHVGTRTDGMLPFYGLIEEPTATGD